MSDKNEFSLVKLRALSGELIREVNTKKQVRLLFIITRRLDLKLNVLLIDKLMWIYGFFLTITSQVMNSSQCES
jgi:hypothetical protein